MIEPVTYESILQPLQVGNLSLKNRIYISAHAYCYYDSDGLPTEQMLSYIEKRAQGGASLIILGETHIGDKTQTGEEIWGESISTDKIIRFYKRISKIAKRYDMKVFEQLFHPGGQVWPEPGAQAYAPSTIAHNISSLIPASMDQNMIQNIIESFSTAAMRVKQGGLDGIELKLDQGKLLHQFMSPFYNRRDDEYGGSLQNRVKIVLEILSRIRDKVGDTFVIGVRIPGDTLHSETFHPVDLNITESIEICKILQNSAMINFISISGATNSNYFGYWQSHGDETIERANFRHISRAIKANVTIPVFLASQILHPDDAVSVIKSGDADIVAMTRAHIADPFIVRKIESARLDNIRPCISCNQSCVGNTWLGRPLACIHNAETGHEFEFRTTRTIKANKNKSLIIIGGGPSGLEASRIAALRGYEVFLYEKSKSLGGQINIAAQAIHRHRWAEITKYQVHQLSQLTNVHIFLDAEITADFIATREFSKVIVATGSESKLPLFPYTNNRYSMTVDEALINYSSFTKGSHYIIVDEDWHMHSLSVADLLTDHGIDVTLVTSHEFSGYGLDIVNLTSFQSRLLAKDIKTLAWSEVVDIDNDHVSVRNKLNNRIQIFKNIEGVIFGINRQPDRSLQEDLKSCGISFKEVGDCIFPRGVDVAILEGYRVGLTI